MSTSNNSQRPRLVSREALEAITKAGATADEVRSACAKMQSIGIMKRDYPGELIEMAMKGDDVHFITGGHWSMYEFLDRALQFTGPAALWLSTFSITETSTRALAIHLDSGALTELHMLVDSRAKIRYPKVHQLAGNIATRIRLWPVHAKVMVLHGRDATLSLVGSANWTENKRLEAGVLTTNVQIAAFHLSWLNQSLNHGNPFEL